MNKDLTKFLLQILKLAALSCITVAVMFILGIFVIGCQYEDGYNAALIDKIARLRAINEPKIILVGNSNLSFGMDSQMLEEAVNMPVVNLGLHGGLGNAFHENMAKLNINSGDIVIICHSTFSDNDRITDMSLAWGTLEYHFELWDILRAKDYPNFIQRFPIYWFKALKEYVHRNKPKSTKANKPNSVNADNYRRYSFNKYGDVITDYRASLTKLKYRSGSVELPKINDTCVNRLNELNTFVRHRNAVMLVAGYPICFGEYTPPVEKYIAFQEELALKLDCEVISDYTDYLIPKKYFYDFILHLNKEGVHIRTEQLIKDLRAWKSRHNNSPAD